MDRRAAVGSLPAEVETGGVLQLRVLVPGDLTEKVVQTLLDDPAISGVVVDRGAALKPAGDLVLADVAREATNDVVDRLRDAVRGSDVVARYGGDEFIALLPQTGPSGALEVAERIRQAIEDARIDVGGYVTRTTVSVGVASYPSDGSDPATMIEKADLALYKAKRAGRNRVVAHSDAQATLPFDDSRLAA